MTKTPVRRHVLFLEPQTPPHASLSKPLQDAGHIVTVCGTAEMLCKHLDRGEEPDLLVLRITREAGSGLPLLRRMRGLTPALIVVIGASQQSYSDRIAALEMGADDYLVSDMPLPEMAARIRAVLRRAPRQAGAPHAAPMQPSASAWRRIQGGWNFAPHQRALVCAGSGNLLTLTGAEFELLQVLEAAGGRAVDRETISRSVFRRGWSVDDRAVDSLVARLRRKLQADAIAPVRGIGYALRYADAPAPPSPNVEICVRQRANASPRMQSLVAK